MFFLKQALNKLKLGTELCVVLPVLMGSKEAIMLQQSLHGDTEADTPWEKKDGFKVLDTWLKCSNHTEASGGAEKLMSQDLSLS